jgi:CCR4-NOT transcription complex subunit 6
VPTARNPNPPPPSPSRWKNRSKTLLAELAALDSDVLAVQEMDQYDDFWAPWLAARGYAGSWKCRTQLTANKKDGCGLFFKSDRFELLAQRHIEFNDIAFGRPAGTAAAAAARETPDDPESLDDARRALVRDCVGTLALLRAKSPPDASPVLVASAHLFWDPAHADVKSAQARRLLEEAADFLQTAHPEATTNTPVILAGDYNSVPGSEVHARMLRGFVPGDGDGDGERLDAIPGTAPLRSAYASALASGCVAPPAEGRDAALAGPSGEPAHTNVTPGFTDCIDYVFVDEGVEVVAAEPISGVETTRAGLPDHQHPSDHLPLTLTLRY